MPNMSGIRAELTREIQRELFKLGAINLHTESRYNNVPVKWLLDALHGQPATSLLTGQQVEATRDYAVLLNVGEMRYTLQKGKTRDEYLGIAAGLGYLLRMNNHTKKPRLVTLKELLLGDTCAAPTYNKEQRYEPTNVGTHNLPIYEVNRQTVQAPEVLATRAQLNPLADNAMFQKLNDLSTFRVALTNWLNKTAPRRYAQQIAANAK